MHQGSEILAHYSVQKHLNFQVLSKISSLDLILSHSSLKRWTPATRLKSFAAWCRHNSFSQRWWCVQDAKFAASPNVLHEVNFHAKWNLIWLCPTSGPSLDQQIFFRSVDLQLCCSSYHIEARFADCSTDSSTASHSQQSIASLLLFWLMLLLHSLSW